jgi:hypothetical protein
MTTTIDLKIEKLRAILADETFSAELREAVRQQLSGLRLDAAPVQPVPVPTVQPVPAPEPGPEQPKSFKGIFDKLIEADTVQERDHAATEDRRQKVCSNCFFRQAITNAACELCNEVPENWLMPSALDSEQQMFSQKTGLDLDQLRAASRSSWATLTPARAQFVALHVRLREAAERAKRQAEAVVTEDLPRRITDEQIAFASRFYELELARLSKEKN